jgi:hypothetical protein
VSGAATIEGVDVGAEELKPGRTSLLDEDVYGDPGGGDGGRDGPPKPPPTTGRRRPGGPRRPGWQKAVIFFALTFLAMLIAGALGWMVGGVANKVIVRLDAVPGDG